MQYRAKVISNHRVRIPPEIRETEDIEEGDYVDIEITNVIRDRDEEEDNEG